MSVWLRGLIALLAVIVVAVASRSLDWGYVPTLVGGGIVVLWFYRGTSE